MGRSILDAGRHTDQFKQERRANELARSAETQREADAARAGVLRLDALHSDFNSPDFRRNRDLAWRYLEHLKKHPEQTEVFARFWVLSQGKPPIPEPAEEESAPSHGIDEFPPYSWAISLITAFFVRLEVNLKLEDGRQKLASAKVLEAVGPFFWIYWREGLFKIADACAKVDIHGNASGAAQASLYFIDPLRDLDARTTTDDRAVKQASV